MNLWLAIDTHFMSLGVEKAHTSEQAYYQFMLNNIYPANIIKLPDFVQLKFTYEIKEDDKNADGYYFSDRD